MAETPKTKDENTVTAPEAKPETKIETTQNPPISSPPNQTSQDSSSSQSPLSPANPSQTPAPTPEKPKSHVWIWVVGGCLGLVLIILIGLAVLGWLGVREVKKEIQKYEPTIQGVQSNIDKMNQEAGEWQKKSEELRASLPNPDEMVNPDGMNNAEMQKMNGMNGR